MGRRCLILALTALLLTGCAGSPGQSAATLAPAESDRVVIYTSHKEEVYGPIVKEFEARTGIWAEVVTGGTNELLARIAGEADAPVCDVIFGGLQLRLPTDPHHVGGGLRRPAGHGGRERLAGTDPRRGYGSGVRYAV